MVIQQFFLVFRISDIASWQWVLEDLSKRLQEAIDALKYEHNALRVVVDRVQKEIKENSNDGSQRGALCPLTDDVEDSIIQVNTFYSIAIFFYLRKVEFLKVFAMAFLNTTNS